MMATKTCPSCQTALPAGFLAGMCPKCLLQLGFRPGMPAEETSTTARLAPPPAPDGRAQSTETVPHYRLVEQIGEGAFGTVWLAERESSSGGQVAVKILKPGMDTRQIVARFEAERRALALMDHPNIARVFDGGATSANRPFFVMELVRGSPLTAYCDRGNLTARERIQLLIDVCHGVQHAHQKGLVHRDLKPSNILIAEEGGRAVPKIIDFGIAKATDTGRTAETLSTQFNQMIGTPAYMSPEQAGFGRFDIDTRTDVYSLGVLLYELLTSRTPLDPRSLQGLDYEAMFKIIREIEPLKPSSRIGSFPSDELGAIARHRSQTPSGMRDLLRGDLDWIALKALENDRERRYPSVSSMAEDLRCYLEDEQVSARPPTTFYRFQKLAVRHKLLFASVSVATAALICGLVIALWQASRARQHLAEARLNAYVSEMHVALQALSENNLQRARQLLEQQRPNPGERDLRGFEWRYLWQNCQGDELAVFRDAPPETFGQCAVAFSPNGKFLAYGGSGKVVVRDATTHQSLASFATPATSITFSPDSEFLLTAPMRPGRILFWDTKTWTESDDLALTNARSPARFSPDGKWLLTGTPGTNSLQLWNMATRQPVATCPQSPLVGIHDRSGLSFSPDGKLVTTYWMDMVSKQVGLRLWKVPTLEPHCNLFVPGVPLLSAAFLPQSQQLLTGSWLDQLLVWDLETSPPAIVQGERGHSAYICAVAVSPGAKNFATSSADQTICLWDTETRKLVARWRGHTREVWGLALSPDGETIASSSLDGTIRLWAGSPREGGESWTNAGIIAGFSSDSTAAVFAPSQDDYRWQVVRGTNRVIVPITSTPPLRFDFDIAPFAIHGPEPIAALGRTRGVVETWDLGNGRRLGSWAAGTNWVTAVAFSPDGKLLATADELGMIRIWESDSFRELKAFHGFEGMVGVIAFSPDGKLLAAGCYRTADTKVWNVDGTLFGSLPFPANHLAFTPESKSLAVCSVPRNETKIWELSSARVRSLKGQVGGMTQVAIAPDGRTLATGAHDRRIKLWNMATAQEVGTIAHPGIMNGLRFSPDGRTLAGSFLVTPDVHVRFFRAPAFDEIAATEQRLGLVPKQLKDF